MGRELRIGAQLVIFLAALASVGLMATAGYLEGTFGRVLGLILAAWVAAPYLVLYGATTRRYADRVDGWVLLLAALALAASGLAIYYHARFVDTEPHSGVDFFVVPAWQVVAAAAISWALHRRHARREDAGAAR